MSGPNPIRLSKCLLGQEEEEAVLRVLRREFLGMGPEVQAFETEIKAYLETSAEVVCVNTGTSALHLAVSCLNLPQSSEVLVPSLTYVASFQAISAAGAVPVACDVRFENGFLDLSSAESHLSPKTKAIMPIHYASDSREMDAVYRFASRNNLRVIEDAAHSFGSTRKGKKIGAEGDILCFSFDGIKNITCGEGGALVTFDRELADRVRDARLLGVHKDTEKRFQGQRSWEFDVLHQGYRYHMSDIMAAIGREQLKKIEQFRKIRQNLALLYIAELSEIEEIELFDYDYENIMSHIFPIKVKRSQRDSLRSHLELNQIATGIHYYPNHFLSLFKREYSLTTVEKLYSQLLTRPLHPSLSTDSVRMVCQTIREFF